MMMLVVVPTEKGLEPTARVKQSGEESRIVHLVFERLELRLAERVVIAEVRAAEALIDPERGEELCEGVALHRSASVSVHDEARLDTVASSGLGKQPCREVLALFGSDHPTHDVAAEQIDDHVGSADSCSGAWRPSP